MNFQEKTKDELIQELRKLQQELNSFKELNKDATLRLKSNENLIKENETLYHNLIERLPDGVYRSTPEGKFVDVNPAIVKMLGYSTKEELLAIDIKTELYFEAGDRESLVLQEKLEELGVYRLRKKDGTGIWVEDHGWYIVDVNGKTLFHEGILRDITERKVAEQEISQKNEELQKLNAQKDKFFSIIAHDLKSPFNSIIGLSEIMVEQVKEKDYDGIEKYAGIIFQSSHRAMNLLMNLMEWARSQTGRMEFNPEYFEMVELINEAVLILSTTAEQKLIPLQKVLPSRSLVYADKAMISTVLRNLVSNAIKFTNKGGEITISVKENNKELICCVKDSGVGISKSDIEKLFRIDESYSTPGTQNEKGTGLGLILCKEFVEKHGGSIWVNSKKGIGSEFCFTIPHLSAV